MQKLIGVCVFCGSSEGSDPAYSQAAKALGRHIAEAKAKLIYGGASIGLMGDVARAALDAGGEVIGIIPQFLRAREIELSSLTELVITPNMHERKERMHSQSDAFVVLPGGLGTLEEVLEAMTWAQLGLHKKPIVFVNIKGFWDPLFATFDRVDTHHFARYGLKELYTSVSRVEDTLPAIMNFRRQAAE
ncbi:MAG: TIGR00730 family Rossman fold protein [Alphaproteobacteria bacterium]|nr:TIGR00730 family Rossman fold protein [Alphaproteobacteria bacterium]